MNAVLFVVMLGAALRGQLLPSPLPPVAPAPAVQEPLPLPLPGLQGSEVKGLLPAPPQPSGKPPALVPVDPDSRGGPGVPSDAQPPDGKKPPAFKLVDGPSPVAVPETATSLKPLPVVSVEPLPPGSAATPCLTLQRSGPASVKVGQAFSYELVVRNAGSLPAAQARLDEELPPGAKFVSAQPMPVVQGDRLQWNLADLAPGSERRIHVEVEAGRDGEWKSQASLTVSVASAMQVHVTGAPAQVLKMTGPASVPAGSAVAFAIRVTNTTGTPLTDVVLRVQMSPGLQHLQGQAIEGSLGDLAPGQVRELTLEAVTSKAGALTADATLLSNGKALTNVQVTVQSR